MGWIGIGDEEGQERERERRERPYLWISDGCFALHCVVLLLFVLLAGACFVLC